MPTVAPERENICKAASGALLFSFVEWLSALDLVISPARTLSSPSLTLAYHIQTVNAADANQRLPLIAKVLRSDTRLRATATW